ncbi:MAG: hypothetical protein H6718_31585 [Polyangiaceae bacterium]|nr:hypothetical protein [Myxococcales bacterium]MCB9589999.1 hypothetical protein [Polyangiaceae bacterium]
MNFKSALLSTCLLAFSAVGCSAASDVAPSDHGKQTAEREYRAGGWTFHDDAFECGGSVRTGVWRGNARHVFAFEGTANETVTFAPDGTWDDRGGILAFVTNSTGLITDWSYEENYSSTKFDAHFDRNDTYFVWVMPLETRFLSGTNYMTMSVHCQDAGCQSDADCAQDESCVQVQCITTPCPALCVAQPTCAEGVTADNRVYAKNFAAGDFQAAQDFVDGFQFVMSGINKGTCESLNTKECRDDAPVCGQPAWADYPKNFASLCEFEKLIRSYAGAEGEAKGAFENGLCEEDTECDFDADPTKHYVGMSPEECQVIRFACIATMSYFSDSCGCGCQDLTPAQ